eukprot:jgi/Bigna1/90820/estExt_fgenesh1_pg.C_800055
MQAIIAHGPDDKSLFVADSYNDLGCLMCRSGRQKDAITYLRLAVTKGSTVVGNADRKVACFEKNLAFAYKSDKRPKKAVHYYRRSMQKYASLSDHANAGEAAYELASLLNDLKAFAKAEPVARECLKHKKEIADEGQIQVIPTLCLLAAIISAPEIAKFDESAELAMSAMKLTRATSKTWSSGSKDQEIDQVNKLILGVKRGRTKFKKSSKKAKGKKTAPSATTTEGGGTNPGGGEETKASEEAAAENEKRIEEWRRKKVESWESGDDAMRKKCPSRPELDVWMERQAQKALAALEAKSK